MKIRFMFPGGRTEVLSGVLVGLAPIGAQMWIRIDATAKISHAIDPRVVVWNDQTGEVLYNPRQNFDSLSKDWQDWLLDHPEWPGEIAAEVSA